MIEKKISQFIKNQFPALYHSDGELFVMFVTAYYQWLEDTDNLLYVTRRLQEYRDVDSTTDQFLLFFKEKYLKNIQFETETDKKLLIKNSLNLYRAKGSARSIELFFRLVFGLPADIYYPGEDVFKTSDNTWIVPRYLELSTTDRTDSLVGKQITGLASGATAFAEQYIRRKTKTGEFKNLLYISDIVGDFMINEVIISNQLYSDSPLILGSVNILQILDTGTPFSKGDIVTIDSDTSNNAIGIVTKDTSHQDLVVTNTDGLEIGFEIWQTTGVHGKVIAINGNILSVANVTGTFANNYNIYWPTLPAFGITNKILGSLGISSTGHH